MVKAVFLKIVNSTVNYSRIEVYNISENNGSMIYLPNSSCTVVVWMSTFNLAMSL